MKEVYKSGWIGVLCCTVFLCAPAVGLADRNEKFEITAEKSLEWHRNDLYFQAKESVKAVQGVTTLYCDEMIARYRDSEESNIDIYRVEALGGVRIISHGSEAYGDMAVYDIDKGMAEMTGDNLRLISEGQKVTARDKFLYWVAKGRLEAMGQAVAVRDGDKIEADKLVATFAEKNGQRELETLEALGNVVITTPEEVLTGAHAFYNAKTGIAEMKDNVRIMRGENFIEGVRGQVDLNTNVSKIFGAETGEAEATDSGKERVRAVFYPKDLEKVE